MPLIKGISLNLLEILMVYVENLNVKLIFIYLLLLVLFICLVNFLFGIGLNVFGIMLYIYE